MASVPSTLVIIDRSPLLADALAAVLRRRGWQVTIGAGLLPAQPSDAAPQTTADVALLRIDRGDVVGDVVAAIQHIRRSVQYVVLFTGERRRIPLATYLSAGAVGWLAPTSTADQVDRKLRLLLQGNPIIEAATQQRLLEELRRHKRDLAEVERTVASLSERECAVLAGLIDGRSAGEIADDHFVSIATVRSQIRSILTKLGVSSQLSAVAITRKYGALVPGLHPANRRR